MARFVVGMVPGLKGGGMLMMKSCSHKVVRIRTQDLLRVHCRGDAGGGIVGGES
jgi:hypothetical protein